MCLDLTLSSFNGLAKPKKNHFFKGYQPPFRFLLFQNVAWIIRKCGKAKANYMLTLIMILDQSHSTIITYQRSKPCRGRLLRCDGIGSAKTFGSFGLICTKCIEKINNFRIGYIHKSTEINSNLLKFAYLRINCFLR